jgi:hypothetical protein
MSIFKKIISPNISVTGADDLTLQNTNATASFKLNNNTAVLDITGDLNMKSEGAVRFNDTAGGEYVAFKAPSSVTASYTLTLPTAVGTLNQVLTTDASGVLSWQGTATGPGDVLVGGQAGAVTLGSTDNSFTLLANNVNAVTIDTSGDLNLLTQNELKFNDSAGGQYVGIKAPTTATTYTLTLPAAVGTLNQVLTTDASGVLSWQGTATGPGDVLSGGQAGALTIGTNDATSFNFLSNNAIQMELDSNGDLNLLTQNELKFNDSDGGQYVGIKAPTTATTYTLTLPAAVGTLNQVLTTDASGVLSWQGTATGPGDVQNGGNTDGASLVIGTNDGFDLELETSGVTRVLIDGTTGYTTFSKTMIESSEALSAETVSINENISFITSTASGEPVITSVGRISNSFRNWMSDSVTDSLGNLWVCGMNTANASVPNTFYDLGTNGTSETKTNSVEVPYLNNNNTASLVKYNSNGIVQYCARIETNLTNGAWIYSIAIDSSDNIYVGGSYASSTSVTIYDMDTVGGTTTTNSVTLPSSGSYVGRFVVKYNNSGIAISSSIIGSVQTSAVVWKLMVDLSNNLWVAGIGGGAASNVHTFNTSGGVASTSPAVTLPINSSTGPFIIKYNSLLEPQTAVKLMSNATVINSYVTDMELDSAGNLWVLSKIRTSSSTFYQDFSVTGGSVSTVVIPNTSSAYFGMMVKYNSSGIVQSAAVLDCDVANLQNLAVDLSDNIYICGEYTNASGTANVQDFSAGGGSASSVTLPTASSRRGCILKYSNAGVAISSMACTHATGASEINDMEFDSNDNLFIVGQGPSQTMNLYDMNGVGGTGASVVYPASSYTCFMFKMNSNDEVVSGGRLATAVGNSNSALSPMLTIDSSANIYIVGDYRNISDVDSVYDFDTSGGTTSNVTVAVTTASSTEGFVMKIKGNTVETPYKLISNLSASDKGLIKKIVNTSTGSRLVAIRNSSDTSTLSTTSFVNSIILVWSGTAWEVLNEGSGGAQLGTALIGSLDNTLTMISNGINASQYDTAGNLNMLTQNEIRWQDASDGEYVGIRVPDIVSASYAITLPAAVGTTGQVLQTVDGGGTMGWVTAATGDINNGGNTTGTAMAIGTQDAFNFFIAASGVPKIKLHGDIDEVTIQKTTTFEQGMRYNFIIVTTSTYTVLSTNYAMSFSSLSAVTVTLPGISSLNAGQTFLLISTGATGAVTINRAGADVIDAGATSIVLSSQYDRVQLINDGSTHWYTI